MFNPRKQVHADGQESANYLFGIFNARRYSPGMKNYHSFRVVALTGVVTSLLAACTSGPKLSGPDLAVHQMGEKYLQEYLAWRPGAGTSLGLHQYDGKVTDYSRESIAAENARLRQWRNTLAAVNLNGLSQQASVDVRALRSALERELFAFEVTRDYTHNPMTYAGAIDLTGYAQRDFAPKPARLKSVIAILNQTPAIVAAGRVNLDERLPRTYVATAIDQANGTAEFINDDLVKAFSDVKDAALQSQFTQARATASEAMKGFATWLEREKVPKADDRFAIGTLGYMRMLHDGELLEQSPEEVLAIGMRELRREQAVFADAARRIDPTKPAIEVCRMMQREHPSEQDLLPESRKHLESIRQFVMARDLVSFPSQVPVILEETPKFERHASTAMMDSPGPFEKAKQAFYYITPTEPEWSATRKEEWLSSFNYYTTDVTTIHEAYPGHYVQFLHLNASSATPWAKAFGSYAYIEGWAHYCERMVIDEGFPTGADDLTHAKYRLAQSQDSLLRICRLCVAVQMHCQSMTVDQATQFFMREGYFAEAPAREEANRGTHDPGYGFYTLGKLQILKLRDDYQRQEGDKFSLKAFHNAMLDNGQPPVRLLREILLKDPTQWNAAL